MDTALKKINKGITFKNEPGDSEMAFVYNVMTPDFFAVYSRHIICFHIIGENFWNY